MLRVLTLFFLSFSLSALEVPLEKKYWEILKYKNIPSNHVSNQDNRLIIQVNSSASPIIHSLPTAQAIKKINVEFEVNGSLNLEKNKQGEKGNDDFLFRIGLVYEGNKKLNFFERAVAPKWVKKLHSLAKDNQGVSHIEFFNLVSQNTLLGKRRPHPLSDLLRENFVSYRSENENQLNFTVKENQITPKKVLALWLSIDGDDTKSKFSIKISRITIEN